MQLVPLGDRIVVRRQEPEGKSPGGIVIPEIAKERPKRGKVLAVGSGTVNDNGMRTPMEIKEGQTVLFTAYAGNDIQHEGEDYLILRESDVLAVIQ